MSRRAAAVLIACCVACKSSSSERPTQAKAAPVAAAPATQPTQVAVPELDLCLYALDLLEQKGWDGSEPLPLRAADLDPARLAELVALEKQSTDRAAVPEGVAEPVYVGAAAVREVSELLLAARAEYVAFLRSKGVAERYLVELDRVLPGTADRIVYHPTLDYDAESTHTAELHPDGPDDADLGLLILHVSAVDLWNQARLLGPVFGGGDGIEAYRKLRDVSLRLSMYHELTHALQRAHANLNARPEDRATRAAYYSGKRLMDADPRHFWAWGTATYAREGNNRLLSNESQAERVSFDALVAHYRLDAAGRDRLFTALHGRLDDARAKLRRIRERMEGRWPSVSPDEMATLLGPVVFEIPDVTLRAEVIGLSRRLAGLPAYAGYMNPMLPEDAPRFWEALAE